MTDDSQTEGLLGSFPKPSHDDQVRMLACIASGVSIMSGYKFI